MVKRIIASFLFCMFAFVRPALAVNIADVADLQNNSTVTPQNYALRPGGDYVITAPIDISAASPSGLAFSGNTLTIDATGMAATGLAANGVNLSGSGETYATGGSSAGVHGVSGTTLTVANAYVEAVSGGAAGAYGMSFGSVVQNSGDVTGKGSDSYAGTSGSETYGLYATSYTASNGASITGNGGGDYAIGVRIAGQYTGASPGAVFGNGGHGAGSVGLSAGAIVAQTDTYVQVMGTGGTGDRSYGIDVGSITADSGYIYGFGGTGTGSDAYGLNVGIVEAGGGAQVQGFGGNDTDSTNPYGINAAAINQTGFSILAAGGGAADNAIGVKTGSWTVSDPSAYISAYGGTGAGAAAVYTGSLDFGGGYFYTSGGSGADAAGVHVDGVATQTNRQVFAQGGNDAGAHGVSAGSYTLAAGRFEAIASPDVDGAYGLNAGDLTVDAGAELMASAGFSSGGYGVFVDDNLTIGGRVEMHRDGKDAASIYVDSTNTVTVGATAVLAPTVHLDGNTATDSGLLQTAAGGNVSVQGGATVDPWFIGSHDLQSGVTVDYLFLDTQGGSITGTFDQADGGSMAIEYVLYTTGGQYFISFNRVIDVPDLIAMVPCDNARRLMAIFDDLYDANDAVMLRVMDAIDHAANRSDLVRIAAHVGRTLVPTAYAKLTGTQHRTLELVQNSVFRRLEYLTSKSETAAVSSAEAWASRTAPRRSGWEGWVDALHQQSSRFTAKCVEFDKPKEKIYGVSMGVGRDYGTVAVAGAFGYAGGSYKSDYTDTGIDNYALTFGARLHDFAPPGGWLRPWISAVGGYVFAEINQDLLNYPGTGRKSSSPSAHMARTSVEAGNDFRFGNLTLSPIAGLDYAYIRQGGYRENDPSGYGLRVRAGNYNSLRPRIGIAASYRVGERLHLGVDAHYRYETLDNRSTFDYGRLSAPGIVMLAEGEKRARHSGTVGAAIRYAMTDRVTLSGGYDLTLEDGYAANRFSLGAAVEF